MHTKEQDKAYKGARQSLHGSKIKEMKGNTRNRCTTGVCLTCAQFCVVVSLSRLTTAWTQETSAMLLAP